MTTYLKYAMKLLEALGAEPRDANKRALVAWAQAEGASCAYNAYATTWKFPDSKLCGSNPHGVQEYRTLEQGISAVVKTLAGEGHGYGAIKRTIKDPKATAGQIADAIGESDWGTSGDLIRAVLKDIQGRNIRPFSEDPLAKKQVSESF
jgi:hypothetical protein